jgi:uncharacterized protein (DUF952 family)
MTKLIYKILPATEWQAALAATQFTGSGIDIADGYIHLSTADQVRETANKWFAGQKDLLLAAFDPADFVETLKWEPSRDGALFPHIYGTIDVALVKSVAAMDAGEGGLFVFPNDIP